MKKPKKNVVPVTLFKEVMFNNLLLFVGLVLVGLLSNGGPGSASGLAFEVPGKVLLFLVLLEIFFAVYLYHKAPPLISFKSSLGYVVSSFAILLFFLTAIAAFFGWPGFMILVPAIIVILILSDLIRRRTKKYRR